MVHTSYKILLQILLWLSGTTNLTIHGKLLVLILVRFTDDIVQQVQKDKKRIVVVQNFVCVN